MTEDQKNSIGAALGRVVSGVYILTARSGEQFGAMMASWVQQTGFDPPSVSVAIAKGRPIAQIIRTSNRLALSIVPNEDKLLMKYFARVKPDQDPFVGVNTKSAPSGIPILADALAYLDCELTGVHELHGDHDLFVARISAAEMLREGTAFAHQRGNGFHY